MSPAAPCFYLVSLRLGFEVEGFRLVGKDIGGWEEFVAWTWCPQKGALRFFLSSYFCLLSVSGLLVLLSKALICFCHRHFVQLSLPDRGQRSLGWLVQGSLCFPSDSIRRPPRKWPLFSWTELSVMLLISAP